MFGDNDPSGYKSGVALAAKKELHIDAFPLPPYSPDLNPLDFGFWDEIESRMVEGAPKTVETVAQYKKRMRLTALQLPAALVAKTVRKIPDRMRSDMAATGHNIKED